MTKVEQLEPAKKQQTEELKGDIKLKLKCNYDLVGKNGEIETKIPDETITLPAKEAAELLDKAWAVRA